MLKSTLPIIGSLLLFAGFASADLIGFYPFDGADPLVDASGNGNDLTIPDGAEPEYGAATGVEEGGYEFLGQERLVCPININPSVNPNLTMGAWVKTSTLDPGLYKVIGHDNGGWDRTIGLDNREGDFRYTSFVGDRRPVVDTLGPESEDEWTFLAAVYEGDEDGFGEVTVYVDVDSTTKESIEGIKEDAVFNPGQTRCSIGNLRPDNSAEGWIGFIDNAFFFNEALSAEQITALRDNGKSAFVAFKDDPNLAASLESPFGILEEPEEIVATISISNDGATETLLITEAEITGPNQANYTLGAVPGSLAPGASGDIQVTFNPGEDVGKFEATLELTTNDESTPAIAIDLKASVLGGELPDPIGLYSFDDPNDPLKDDSGNDNDLESADADPEYLANGGLDFSGAFNYDGQSRLIAPIDINPFEIEELTLGAFVKPSSLAPGLRKVMGHDNGGWDRTTGLDNRDGGFRYTSFIGNGRPVIDLPGPENTDDWALLVAVYDEPNGEVTVYVDTDVSTQEPLVAVTEPTVFGDGFDTTSIGSLRPDNNAEGWQGDIDEVFFVDQLLAEEQVTIIRNQRQYRKPTAGDPDLELTLPTLVDLPKAPSVKDLSIGVTSTGATQNVEISEVTISGVDASHYTLGDPPGALAPGLQGTIPISFDSLGQVGEFDAVITVKSNSSKNPTAIRSLSVTIVAEGPNDPVLAAGPNPFTGLQASPGMITRQLTISNTGAAEPLAISSAGISGDNAANYSIVSGPPAPIPAGGQGVYEVTFDPQGKAGTFRASLDLKSTNASGRSASIDITADVPLDPGNLAQALIGFWSFDDPDNPTKDDSGNGNDLEMDGSDPIYGEDTGFGESGGFEFLGTEHLIAPIDINPSEEPVLSWGAWVKTLSLDSGLRKVMGHDNGGWDRTIGLDNREGDFRYSSFIGNGRPVVDTPGPESEEDWTFLAAVYDEDAGEVTVYVDLDATTTDDEVVAVSEPTMFNPGQDTFAIGSLRPDNTAEAWVGFIDNPFVFRAVLSAGDIAAIRDAGSPIPGFGPGASAGFRITEVSIGADGSVTISWDGARASDTYIVEISADLQLWEEVTDGIEETTFTIPGPAVPVSELYHRVRVEP